MTIITCKLGETAEILIPKEMLKDVTIVKNKMEKIYKKYTEKLKEKETNNK